MICSYRLCQSCHVVWHPDILWLWFPESYGACSSVRGMITERMLQEVKDDIHGSLLRANQHGTNGVVPDREEVKR